MKKHLIMALGLALITAGAFATDLGFGNILSTHTAAYNDYNDYGDYTYGDYKWKTKWRTNGVGGGWFVFLGWKYFDINVELSFADMVAEYRSIEYNYYSGEIYYDFIALRLGLYFKVPFAIGNRMRLYPTIGVHWGWNWLSVRAEMGDDLGDEYHIGASFSFLGLRGGAGVDVYLRGNMYLRGNILYGLDGILYEDYGDGIIQGHGFLFKVGLGWRL